MNKIDLFQSSFYKYHALTKHTVEKLLSSQYSLDWNNEPDPFRIYKDTKKIFLSSNWQLAKQNYFSVLTQLLSDEKNKKISHKANLEFISKLLYFSMAISAIKQILGTNHRWALRVNPSSGNLHPTETNILVQSIEGLDAGLYHYSVKEHALEQRSDCKLVSEFWAALQTEADTPPIAICLTSIFEREAWKYRQRAFRYCMHDMGHAQAAISFAAYVFGWQTKIYAQFPDDKIKELLGLTESDEKPMLILGLYPNDKKSNTENIQYKNEPCIYHGKPNILTQEKIKYTEIDNVYESTCITSSTWEKIKKQKNQKTNSAMSLLVDKNSISIKLDDLACTNDISQISVYHTIRKRRSAVDMDSKQYMTKSHLGIILASTLQGNSIDVQSNLIDLYLYIHKVSDTESGLYYFDRNNHSIAALKQNDEQAAAKFVSCFQDIAAHSCLTISMIANMDLAYNLYGNRCYRYMHFEAGYIGQFLYLTSFALGYDATGIGCFIDDEINHYLKLPKGQEVIYNFTIGKAIIDKRLTDLPAYNFPEPNLNP
jgi:SagB-type dehydrogenase family enzyme